LTDEGIQHLRTYLNLPADVVPATLKKTTRAIGERRPPGGGDRGDRPPRRFDGPPREGGGGYREGYRSGGAPREGGGYGRGAPADKVRLQHQTPVPLMCPVWPVARMHRMRRALSVNSVLFACITGHWHPGISVLVGAMVRHT
jgi:hypothetical protein